MDDARWPSDVRKRALGLVNNLSCFFVAMSGNGCLLIVAALQGVEDGNSSQAPSRFGTIRLVLHHLPGFDSSPQRLERVGARNALRRRPLEAVDHEHGDEKAVGLRSGLDLIGRTEAEHAVKLFHNHDFTASGVNRLAFSIKLVR